MLNHVRNGRLTLEKLVELMCYGPQRVHGVVGKGRIARGYDADFTIVDLNKRVTITNAQQQSRAGWTPFDGMPVTGWPIYTVVNGHIVMSHDELVQDSAGQPIKFFETLYG
jgi:dihydroorotase